MDSSKVKTFTVIFALVLVVGLATVGCKQKAEKQGWVNTKSLPGNTFSQHTPSAANDGGPSIVYMGAGSSASHADSNFGPRDVSFEFDNLR